MMIFLEPTKRFCLSICTTHVFLVKSYNLSPARRLVLSSKRRKLRLSEYEKVYLLINLDIDRIQRLVEDGARLASKQQMWTWPSQKHWQLTTNAELFLTQCQLALYIKLSLCKLQLEFISNFENLNTNSPVVIPVNWLLDSFPICPQVLSFVLSGGTQWI